MSKRFLLLLSIISLLFLILFAILSYFSRLATDDYYFIGDLKNRGTFEQVWFQYKYWSGRYTATFAMNVIYNLLGIKQTYYNFLPPLSLFLLITGIYTFLKNLIINYSIQLKKSILIIYSICIASIFFFLSYDIAESWFWYCGYSSYLWSITALILGTGLLISKNCKWYNSLLLCVCFLYVGGASELYSAIIGLYYTYIVFSIYKKQKTKNNFWQNRFNKKLIIGYVSFSIAFILLLIAPGNYVRDTLFPEHSFFYAFFLTGKSFVKFTILYLPIKSIYLIGFSPLFILMGIYLKEQLNFSFSPFRKMFKKITLIFFSTLFLFFYTTAYVMVEAGPARVLFFVSFLFTCYIIFISFYAGLTISFKNQYKLKLISVFILIPLLIFHIINQTLIASNYSKANDERIAYILNLKEKIKTDTLILLTPLPPSGMLYSSEITNDTTHFTNREVKMGYDLPFYVVKRDKINPF